MNTDKLNKNQAELAQVMSNISWEARSADWERYNEYIIWMMLNNKIIKRYNFYSINSYDRKRLKNLSKKIGGWICCGENGLEFVSIDEWLKMYDLHNKHMLLF